MADAYNHGGDIYQAAKKYSLSEKDILDFSASINILGASPRVYQVLREQLWRIGHYPDPGKGQLYELLADFLAIDPRNIVFANGCAEIIYQIPQILKIKKALILAPTFSLYEKSIEANEGKVEYEFIFPELDFCLSKISRERLNAFDAIYLCNPNNPTGGLFSRDEIRVLLEKARETETLLIVDEAFIDFVRDKEKYSVIPLIENFDNLLVLYSMTKFFGFPGLRLGALVASRETINQINSKRDPWGVNALAISAGEEALKDKSHIRATLAETEEEKDHLFLELANIPGFKPHYSKANFLLVDIRETGVTSRDLTEIMAKKGILIRDCSNFIGFDQGYIRLAIRTRKDNEILLREFKRVLEPENY
jgi:threonine-phosphate decarboxylase